ncbi:hypothetical protein [Streptomyces mirabilis]|uniref:hypothetical protein n=1 Tax=Streptomyces mirabilis TaxID=68239 RepID=UPI0036C942E9
MAPPLSPLDIQRLAYIRFLYEEGAEYARRPHPLSCTAVLTLHDAVENFLGLAADHHGTNPDPKIQFMQYWSELKTKAQIDLPGKGAMTGLNAARVALKHHGTFASDQTIQGAVRDVLRFFTTATPIVFDVDFDSIDMVDLVTQPEVAQLLRDAQTHADVGDFSMAAAGLSLAFEALLSHYSGRNTRARWKPFAFGRNLDWADRPRLDGREAPRDGRLAKLGEIAEATQEAMRAISLGIDYPSLSRFRIITPSVHGYFMGRPRYVEERSHTLLTAEDYNWARHFVIESALRCSRADGLEELQRTQMEVNRAGREDEGFVNREWTGPVESRDETAEVSGSQAPTPQEVGTQSSSL